jgi:hypothetical protein
MLQYLKARENNIICLHFLFLSESGSVKEENKIVGRLQTVGMDYFVLISYRKGRKNTRLYPYPTQGLQSISIDLDEVEDSDIIIQFQKEEYEYHYQSRTENIKSKHPEM